MTHLSLRPNLPSSSPLDPKQPKTHESLNIPTVKDPYNNCPPSKSFSTAVTCDSGSPFPLGHRNILTNCSSDLSLSLSLTALSALSPSVISLSIQNCPSLSSPPRLPDFLHSFTAVNSFLCRRNGLARFFLVHLVNFTNLTVTSVHVSTAGLFVTLGNMHKIV